MEQDVRDGRVLKMELKQTFILLVNVSVRSSTSGSRSVKERTQNAGRLEKGSRKVKQHRKRAKACKCKKKKPKQKHNKKSSQTYKHENKRMQTKGRGGGQTSHF